MLTVTTAIGAIWLCTLINLRGIGAFGLAQNILTALKLIPLLLVGILGWFSFHPEYLRIPEVSELPSGSGGYAKAIATTAALTLWSFIGLESATVPADHVRDPKRTIPRATVFGTLVAAAVYILSITAVQGVLPPEVLMRSTAPFADAARVLIGDWGYHLVAAGAVIACLGALNGWVLLQGQIPMATARDGLLPESLAKTNKYDVPANGLLISGVLVTALVLVDGRGDLVDVFNVIILLGTMTGVVPYAFCTAALLQQLAVQPGISPRANAVGWWPSACSASSTRSGRCTAPASRRSSGASSCSWPAFRSTPGGNGATGCTVMPWPRASEPRCKRLLSAMACPASQRPSSTFHPRLL